MKMGLTSGSLLSEITHKCACTDTLARAHYTNNSIYTEVAHDIFYTHTPAHRHISMYFT